MREVAAVLPEPVLASTATASTTWRNSNAHETYWDVRNAITDLAAVRLLFPLTIQVSHAARPRRRAARRLAERARQPGAVPGPNGAYLPHDPPISQTRNNENVVGRADLALRPAPASAPPTTQTAINTWNVRPNPYGNVWANDHVQAARLGLGDQAFQGMKTMLQKYQNYPNGMTNNTNGVFEYLGVHLSAMNESLMQSYNDKIRVFPAVADRLPASSASSPCWPRTASWSARSARPARSSTSGCKQPATASRPGWSTRGAPSRSRSAARRTTRSSRRRPRRGHASPPRPTRSTWWSGPRSRCRPTRRPR